MDKHKAKQLGVAVEAALQAVAAAHGMTVEVRGSTFDTGGLYKPRVEFKDDQFERIEFERVASLLGFKAEDYGRTFDAHGHTFTLIGLKPGTKMPVLARRSDGKVYKLMLAAVRTTILREVPHATV